MKFLTFFILLFVTATSAVANDAILRVSCQPQDAGSKVYINGTLKGECPVDIMLDAGPVTLEVKKTVDAEYMQTFKQQFTVYAGAAKRVVVELSEPQLTPAAKKARERAAMLQKKKEAEEQKKQEIATLRRNKKAAGAGDIDAMEALAQSYEHGTGTRKNSAKAKFWAKKAENARIDAEAAAIVARLEAEAQRDLKAAEAGDISAMGRMADHYTRGFGVEKDTVKAEAWNQKARLAREKSRVEKEEKEKARRRAEIEEKLKKHEFILEHMYKTSKKNGTQILLTTFVPISLPFDITTLPTRLSNLKERLRLQRELDALAAVWASPDSMVAKAWRQEARRREIASR